MLRNAMGYCNDGNAGCTAINIIAGQIGCGATEAGEKISYAKMFQINFCRRKTFMEYSSYSQVPWYRKQGICIFVGFIFFPALLPILLTGHVYYAKNGQVLALNKTEKWFLSVLGFMVFSMIGVMMVKSRPTKGWGHIGESPSMTYYADPSSIVTSGDKAAIWLLADNNEAQKDRGISYVSSTQQFEIDCKEGRKRLIHYELYSEGMGKGSEVAAYNLPDQEWSPAPSGTVAGTMRELACKPWWKFWN